MPALRQKGCMEGCHRGGVSLAFAADGRLASGGWEDGSIIFWNAAGEELFRRENCHRGAVRSLAFAADGRLASGGGSDGSIIFWNAAGEELFRRENCHRGRVLSLAFAADGRLASGGREYGLTDGSIIFWNAAGEELFRRENCHRATVCSLAFAADGRLASGGGLADGSIIFWNAAGEELFRRENCHRGTVLSLAFAADGRLASGGGGGDGSIILWNATGEELFRRENCHRGAVCSLAFAADGRLASGGGGADGSIIFWNAAGEELFRRENCHQRKVWSLAFAADGRLASGGREDGSIIVWTLEVDFKAGGGAFAFADVAQGRDQLDNEILADAIVQVGCGGGSQAEDSMTIGLYAPWGSGKSQLLHLVRLQLLSSNARHVAAWQHEERRWRCGPVWCLANLSLRLGAWVLKLLLLMLPGMPRKYLQQRSAPRYSVHCQGQADALVNHSAREAHRRCEGKLQMLGSSVHDVLREEKALPAYYIPVWFNSWVYSGGDHLWAGMLTEIQRSLDLEYGRTYLRLYSLCTSSFYCDVLLPSIRLALLMSCPCALSLKLDRWACYLVSALCWVGFLFINGLGSYDCHFSCFPQIAGFKCCQACLIKFLLMFLCAFPVLASLLLEFWFESPVPWMAMRDFLKLPDFWASWPLVTPVFGLLVFLWPAGPWKGQLLSQVTETAARQNPAKADFKHLLGPMRQVRKEMLNLREFLRKDPDELHVCRLLRGEVRKQRESDEEELEDEKGEADVRDLEAGTDGPEEASSWHMLFSTRGGRARQCRHRPKKRLFIVIDDLDRCPQDKAVEVLQSLVLLSENMPFFIILAVDLRVVTNMVEQQLGELLVSSGINGLQFLDKIVQLPFAMPALSVDQRVHFLECRLHDVERRVEDRIKDANVEALLAEEPVSGGSEEVSIDSPESDCEAQKLEVSAEKDSMTVSKPAITESMEPLQHLSEKSSTPSRVAPLQVPPGFTASEKLLWRTYSPFLASNPRRILRLLNTFNVARILRTSPSFQDDPSLPNARPAPEQLLKCIILFEQWPYRMSWLLKVVEADRQNSFASTHCKSFSEAQLQELTGLSQWLRKSEKWLPGLEDNTPLQEIFSVIEEYCWDISLWEGSRSRVYVDHRSCLGMDGSAELFECLMDFPPKLVVKDLHPFSPLLQCVVNRSQSLEERVGFQASQRVQQQNGSWKRRSQCLLEHDRQRKEKQANLSTSFGQPVHRLSELPSRHQLQKVDPARQVLQEKVSRLEEECEGAAQGLDKIEDLLLSQQAQIQNQQEDYRKQLDHIKESQQRVEMQLQQRQQMDSHPHPNLLQAVSEASKRGGRRGSFGGFGADPDLPSKARPPLGSTSTFCKMSENDCAEDTQPLCSKASPVARKRSSGLKVTKKPPSKHEYAPDFHDSIDRTPNLYEDSAKFR